MFSASVRGLGRIMISRSSGLAFGNRPLRTIVRSQNPNMRPERDTKPVEPAAQLRTVGVKSSNSPHNKYFLKSL
jgi:hypothetical protein